MFGIKQLPFSSALARHDRKLSAKAVRKSREDMRRGQSVTVTIPVEKNCLISYTGHLDICVAYLSLNNRVRIDLSWDVF